MKSLVLDGSTTLALLLHDESSSYATRAYRAIESGRPLYVPSHWWLETTNGLLMAERRKRISQAEVPELTRVLHALAAITDEETASRCASETLSLARQYTLTVYDAAYLELAVRRGSELATLDKALAKAALSAGVDLLE
jgi:predicted nucleic acid-binding protein